MRLGIDVGVDAQSDRSGFADCRCDVAQRQELRFALDVEPEDTRFERIGHFGARLADARENDLRRRHTRGPSPAKFAFGYDVHAGSDARHRREDGLVGVGLDGETDERVLVAKGVRQYFVVTLERRGRIAIEWRADLVGDACEAYVLSVEDAGFVVEVMHGSASSRTKRSRQSEMLGKFDG